MSIVIFGGDHLGKIPALLETKGFQLIQHVSGRKKGELKSCIPQGVEAVLVLTDYLNHGLALEVKAAAKARGVHTLFVRRSWSSISQALEAFQNTQAKGLLP